MPWQQNHPLKCVIMWGTVPGVKPLFVKIKQKQTRDAFQAAKIRKKGSQECLISRRNPISVNLRMDVFPIREKFVSVFYEATLAGCFLKI